VDKGSAMQRWPLGDLFEVSVLTRGGGRIGREGGSTDRAHAVATVRAAYHAGITLRPEGG
jgi:aryl-alcohol dehydrogenase-like predicted oxidoreductase